ncbi:MAG: hypothetical protein H6Q97_779, partial [Nitrospirae bacterium]|nr:hypothetical protein [Nitrospirota bacterium]
MSGRPKAMSVTTKLALTDILPL